MATLQVLMMLQQIHLTESYSFDRCRQCHSLSLPLTVNSDKFSGLCVCENFVRKKPLKRSPSPQQIFAIFWFGRIFKKIGSLKTIHCLFFNRCKYTLPQHGCIPVEVN